MSRLPPVLPPSPRPGVQLQPPAMWGMSVSERALVPSLPLVLPSLPHMEPSLTPPGAVGPVPFPPLPILSVISASPLPVCLVCVSVAPRSLSPFPFPHPGAFIPTRIVSQRGVAAPYLPFSRTLFPCGALRSHWTLPSSLCRSIPSVEPPPEEGTSVWVLSTLLKRWSRFTSSSSKPFIALGFESRRSAWRPYYQPLIKHAFECYNVDYPSSQSADCRITCRSVRNTSVCGEPEAGRHTQTCADYGGTSDLDPLGEQWRSSH